MAKTFFTERDIEDLVHQGKDSLLINDDVVLTDLAYEKARVLGVTLLRDFDHVPCAPVRPYLTKKQEKAAPADVARNILQSIDWQKEEHPATAEEDALHQRIRSAVLAQVGDIDPVLLDRIIQRVLVNLGLR